MATNPKMKKLTFVFTRSFLSPSNVQPAQGKSKLRETTHEWDYLELGAFWSFSGAWRLEVPKAGLTIEVIGFLL
jgi:hypothetical protein